MGWGGVGHGGVGCKAKKKKKQNDTQCQCMGIDFYQDLHGGGLDGDVDGVQVSLLNPPHPLDVHI